MLLLQNIKQILGKKLNNYVCHMLQTTSLNLNNSLYNILRLSLSST